MRVFEQSKKGMILKMDKIVVATNNKSKIKEIKEILKDYELLTLKDVNCEIEVEENEETFEGNSLKKAKEISEIIDMPCIADDSGLCIDALYRLAWSIYCKIFRRGCNIRTKKFSNIRKNEGFTG